jgi:branched-chain amino acid transport system substrate-binding protein
MRKLLGAVMALCLLGLGSAQAADTVKIGLMAPLTGSWASEGVEMRKAVELLVEETNAKGGLNGKKVELFVEDDGSDPRTSSLAAQRLTTKGVVAVIGTYGSAVTEAAQGIYNEAKIIHVATGSTAVRLTEKGLKYFLRTSPRDDDQGAVAAAFLLKQNYKKIAILHDNSAYSKGLADSVNNNLKGKPNVNVVFFDALTPKEQDYSAVLTRLKAVNPEVVYFSGYYPESGLLLKQKKQMNWNVPFMGGDAQNNPDIVKIAGKDSADGFRFTSPPIPKDLDSSSAKAFLASYQKKFGAEPGSIWGVLAGDAYLVIAEGIQKAGTTDPDKVRGYLSAGMKEYPGLTGKLSFNEKGDRVGDLYRVYKIDPAGQFGRIQ